MTEEEAKGQVPEFEELYTKYCLRMDEQYDTEFGVYIPGDGGTLLVPVDEVDEAAIERMGLGFDLITPDLQMDAVVDHAAVGATRKFTKSMQEAVREGAYPLILAWPATSSVGSRRDRSISVASLALVEKNPRPLRGFLSGMRRRLCLLDEVPNWLACLLACCGFSCLTCRERFVAL